MSFSFLVVGMVFLVSFVSNIMMFVLVTAMAIGTGPLLLYLFFFLLWAFPYALNARAPSFLPAMSLHCLCYGFGRYVSSFFLFMRLCFFPTHAWLFAPLAFPEVIIVLVTAVMITSFRVC